MAPRFEARIRIRSDADIVAARRQGRALAEQMGFSSTDVTVIATAISEVARNIVQYAREGEVVVSATREDGRDGLTIVARDQGPGIADVVKAMQPGYSTANSLGLGLPGARRLMDDFEISSRVGEGTTVTMTKWQR
ncbi:MAG: anti-sigma regulatory factor [Gemmatimonadetes bacterium]|nr:anti-sigma regulatory factor [Gemmatimonadota bacterium]